IDRRGARGAQGRSRDIAPMRLIGVVVTHGIQLPARIAPGCGRLLDGHHEHDLYCLVSGDAVVKWKYRYCDSAPVALKNCVRSSAKWINQNHQTSRSRCSSASARMPSTTSPESRDSELASAPAASIPGTWAAANSVATTTSVQRPSAPR